MSIYATWLSIDADDHGDCARWVPCTREEARTAGRVKYVVDGSDYRYDGTRRCTCEAGPLIYQGSHVNPASDELRGGELDIAAIPNHCHPDVRGTGADTGPPVEFLRLSLDEHPATFHGGHPGRATVVLTRAQVAEVHETLGAWLAAKERW